MISYPISLPSSPGMVSVKPGATSIVGSSVGEFDGAVQRQWWGDLGFDFQCQLPPMTRNNAEAWAAALSALRSGYGTCYFGDPSGRIAQGAAGRQGVNLALWSEDMTNAVWAKTNTTVTLNAATAPDGTNTAMKVAATATALTLMTQTLTAGGVNNTYSIYVKQGTGSAVMNRFGLRNVTTATNLIFVTIDYSTGILTITSGAGTVASAALGSGWYRISLTVSAGISVGDQLSIYVCENGGSETVGTFAYVWHPQDESAAAASTYVGTTTGSGLVSGSSANGPNQAGSRTLAMRGMAPSTIALKAGDYFHHGAGDGSATRITTTPGTNVVQYLYYGALSVNAQAYIATLRLRNMGAYAVTVITNSSPPVVQTVLPGAEALVSLPFTGDGVNDIGIKFQAPSSANPLDFIAWTPRIARFGYDENLVAASSRSFAGAWGTFSGAGVTLLQNVGQRLYKVMQDATSDASGNVVADVFPALRNAVTDGDSLTFASPKGVFRLADPKAAWSINNALLYGVQFNLQEAIV